MKWPFAKYTGCGNDFILFDNRTDLFPKPPSALAQKLCHRQMGIGADGLILLEQSALADYKMRIFNADGSEAEMCGNGIRCLAHWVSSFTSPAFQIEAGGKIYGLSLEDSYVRVNMPLPAVPPAKLSIDLAGEQHLFYFLNTGVPHAVTFVEDLLSIPVASLGPAIRFHPLFEPAGANATFAQRQEASTFKMRTYERGVEAETWACGTGAAAVALAAHFAFGVESPIAIEMRSGEKLHMSLNVDSLSMSGAATAVFEGEIDL